MTRRHLDNLAQRAPSLVPLLPQVEEAFVVLRDAFRRGGKALVCGNGGSASDAEHWAGELLKGFAGLRPLDAKEKALLPDRLASRLQGALPMIPLTGFPALSTAFANDVAPELVFAQLVWGLGRAGDVFIGISTSGHAANVCAAAEVARARGLFVLGLTGQTGGTLKTLCDLCLCVPAHETYRAQEYHLPIYHCLALMLEDEFFGQDETA